VTPTLVAPPTAALVTVDEARRQARIDDHHEDDLVQNYIDAAVSMLDGWGGILGRAIMPQTWRQQFDGWGTLRLALPDVQSVAVTYRDAEGEMQPIEASLGADALGAYVEAEGPDTDLVRVDYVCAMPESARRTVRQAVVLQVAAWADDRAGASELSPGAMALVSIARRQRV
jgi:uncharacterized phiE125 gp8 family phage protein